MKAYHDLRIHTFESEVCQPLWTSGKGGSAVGYGSSESLCLFVRGRGCTSRQGEGSWLSGSPPALLSLDFAFSRVRKREAHRLMLFAWPYIMHEMIHNLLSLVYHLQRINNGVLASCFFSICHCCLSNPVYEEWMVWFCPCFTSSQKSNLIEQLVCIYFQPHIIPTLLCCCVPYTSSHLLSQLNGVWVLRGQWEWRVTGECPLTSIH